MKETKAKRYNKIDTFHSNPSCLNEDENGKDQDVNTTAPKHGPQVGKIDVDISCIEIYNENIQDLLRPIVNQGGLKTLIARQQAEAAASYL